MLQGVDWGADFVDCWLVMEKIHRRWSQEGTTLSSSSDPLGCFRFGPLGLMNQPMRSIYFDMVG